MIKKADKQRAFLKRGMVKKSTVAVLAILIVCGMLGVGIATLSHACITDASVKEEKQEVTEDIMTEGITRRPKYRTLEELRQMASVDITSFNNALYSDYDLSGNTEDIKSHSVNSNDVSKNTKGEIITSSTTSSKANTSNENNNDITAVKKPKTVLVNAETSKDTIKAIEQEKLVYIVNATIRSDDPANTYKKIKKDFEEKYAAAFTDESLSYKGGAYYSSQTITCTIRVKAEKYNSARASLEKYGFVSSLNSEASNISDNYKEIEGRIKTLTKEVNKINELISKANTAGEIADLNTQLQYLQAELDYNKSELSKIKQDMAYSYIYLTLKNTEKAAEREDGFSGQIKYVAKQSFNIFIVIGKSIVLGMVFLCPVLIMVGIICVTMYFIKKAKLRKNRTVIDNKETDKGDKRN